MAKEKVIQILAYNTSMYGLTSDGNLVILAGIGRTPFAGSEIHVNEDLQEVKQEKQRNKYDYVEPVANEVEVLVKPKKTKQAQRP